jgi:hypothetical protein
MLHSIDFLTLGGRPTIGYQAAYNTLMDQQNAIHSKVISRSNHGKA